MIRLTSYHNGSPIYVPADVVIKENYEHEFGINYAMPTAKYKPLGGAMLVYDGIEYAVKESQEEVARKVLEWRLVMERYRAYVNAAASEEKPQVNECWELAANARAELARLAGLEEPNHDNVREKEPQDTFSRAMLRELENIEEYKRAKEDDGHE